MKSFPKKSDLSVQATAIMPLLIRMLKDESPDNRAKAAEALSFLHSISWFWFTNSLLHFFIIQFSFLHISHSSYLLQSAILYFLKWFFSFQRARQMSRLTRIGFEFGLLKRLTSSVTKSTSGYVPIFGYKSDSLWRNPLLRERRNAQYHLMSLCLAPYYLGEYNLLVSSIYLSPKVHPK